MIIEGQHDYLGPLFVLGETNSQGRGSCNFSVRVVNLGDTLSEEVICTSSLFLFETRLNSHWWSLFPTILEHHGCSWYLFDWYFDFLELKQELLSLHLFPAVRYEFVCLRVWSLAAVSWIRDARIEFRVFRTFGWWFIFDKGHKRDQFPRELTTKTHLTPFNSLPSHFYRVPIKSPFPYPFSISHYVSAVHQTHRPLYSEMSLYRPVKHNSSKHCKVTLHRLAKNLNLPKFADS